MFQFILTLTACLVLMSNTNYAQDLVKSEVIPVRGKGLYYEVYGKGEPLILLHGYSQSSKSWLPYVSDFGQEYSVYLIDLTGHGKSDAFKEDLSVKDIAEDLYALIQYLKLERIKAIGFSFGGDILYQLALLDKTLMESMITIGAVGTWTIHDFPEYKKGFTYENRQNFPWLKAAHTDEKQVEMIMDQFINYTVELSNDELQQIQPEVLVMIGDDDPGMKLEEVARVKRNLPKSDIWILPNVSHGVHEGATKADFIVKAKAFFTKVDKEK